MQNKTLKDKDILDARNEFMERARKYAEFVTAGKQIPEEVRLKEKQVFLVQYHKQIKIVEEAKKASMQRFDEEIRQLKNSIEQIEKEIKKEQQRFKRFSTKKKRLRK